MRIRTIGILGASALVVSACGSSGGKSPVVATPPTPINLSVYINDSRVSVSPQLVGAGPVVFVVTNQASHAESLDISLTGKSGTVASTAPINPQGTTQVSVNFRPGKYTVSTGPRGSTDASLTQPSSIRPALVLVGRRRASAGSSLLEP
ncbi:MAG: hypothetical protein WAK93_17440 [Solirubrobacteraceae bacterium]